MRVLVVILVVLAFMLLGAFFFIQLLSVGQKTSLDEQQECLREDARLRAEKQKAREERKKNRGPRGRKKSLRKQKWKGPKGGRRRVNDLRM